jgi:hypothetical protein
MCQLFKSTHVSTLGFSRIMHVTCRIKKEVRVCYKGGGAVLHTSDDTRMLYNHRHKNTLHRVGFEGLMTNNQISNIMLRVL